MSILQNMAIKHKLVAIIMLACATGLLLTGAAITSWGRGVFRDSTVRDVTTLAEITAENCKAALSFQDAKAAKETLQALNVEPSIVFGCVYVTGDDSKPFAAYYRDSGYAETKIRPSGFKDFIFSGGFLTVFRPIIVDKDTLGTVCLRSDLRPMHIIFKQSIIAIIIVLFISFLVAFLVTSRLQKIISGPILSLAEVAKAVSEKKDYSTRAIKHSGDEVGLLIDSFNEMLEHIQHRDSELVEAKEKLEARVEERTAELTTTNEQLTLEIGVRKEVEGQLRKTEEKYRTQFEGAMDAIFVADAETGILVDCNPAATRFVGREKSELIGQPQQTLHPAEVIDDGGFSKTFREHLKGKQGQTLETQIITKTGEIKDVAIKASLIEVRGKKLMQGIFRDITENKKAEALRSQLLEQLGSANQELKDFAYVVSHDLKAPLRGIKTLTDWMMTDYADKLGESGKEQINLLTSRVNRMHNLIDGILQYSRVGRVQEDKVQIKLNELVPEIIDTIAPPENITITIENELPTIEFEPTRITQVFQNLLSNAVKYMDKPKGLIKVGYVEEDGFWKFSVADNGPGIEEKHFERIFQMFQTLAPRDEFESTGVGLTVAKKIVELYKGKIWLESEVGQGSTFFFTLPKQEVGAKDEKLEANIIS
ncbi:MAG: ATP-binding protein [Sedimentisphaerales bacterium]